MDKVKSLLKYRIQFIHSYIIRKYSSFMLTIYFVQFKTLMEIYHYQNFENHTYTN